MTNFDAILPAGGRIGPELSKRVGTDVKALIKFGEKTILSSTLEALKDSGLIGRTIVIGGEKVKTEASKLADEILPEGATGPENILNGLKYLLGAPNPPSKVFVITTDLPFVTSGTIQTYLAQCPDHKDICVPLVSRTEWDMRFPNSSATFAKLQDGSWTTGCAYVIDVSALEAAMPQIEKVFANRKSIFGMAKLLGPKFLLKFLTKTLNVPDLEIKIQSMLGCSGAAIRNAPTELAYDIDDLEDYEYALQVSEKS